ncbi:DNA polymerase III subunit delta' [Mesorhizobium sp. NBSH29]|uniref:DNA polymerase III subunit delta' n=1 Tax=Mesorhizobium sp. NBSH29 TaxID=2654249 RepID=UPI0018964687|nr:DNA polymerase III subunit delta' [Mesorhizobium sp. NBSH29]QPC87736.1 DNA polymerase III subunit delta' [Mesorhizobium sp. NBSH29]
MIFERRAPEQFDSIEGVPEPSENPRLVGHAEVAAMLASAYRVGKLPHAILLAGPSGIGKATLAFHLAHHLLRHPSSAQAPSEFSPPDPASSLSRQIASGAHPSVLHLTRPANDKTKGYKSVITVDEVRRVSRFLSMTSHDNSYRVVIVDTADDLNTNAANALLKNLEEPPSRTIFLLITHSIGRLLPTIRSRCQTVLMQPLSAADMFAVLEGFNLSLTGTADKRAALAAHAGGSPRNAIHLTQYGGLEIASAIEALAYAPAIDIAQAHRLADAVAARDQQAQFQFFNRHVLDIVTLAASEAARASNLARAGRLSAFWQRATETMREAETYNLDKKQHVLGTLHSLHAAMRG